MLYHKLMGVELRTKEKRSFMTTAPHVGRACEIPGLLWAEVTASRDIHASTMCTTSLTYSIPRVNENLERLQRFGGCTELSPSTRRPYEPKTRCQSSSVDQPTPRSTDRFRSS